MNGGSGYRISARCMVVAICLLGLTAAAVLVPRQPLRRSGGTLLALLPTEDAHRKQALADLASYLGRQARLDLQLQIAPDRTAFDAALPRAVLTFSPDAVALDLPSDRWQALVSARRRATWSQLPSSALVYRRDAEAGDEPWLTAPDRTVFGDSLSLVCLAPLCRNDRLQTLPDGVGWGADPYDHRAVLAAAAHGAYDHAVVREWDALVALSTGWLDSAGWSLRRLSRPMPDVVLFASRDLPAPVRMDLQEALTLLGRNDGGHFPAGRLTQARLGLLGLDGFNPLLGHDVEHLRRQYGGCRSNPAR